jgi:hypothetical protein
MDLRAAIRSESNFSYREEAITELAIVRKINWTKGRKT